MPEHTICNTVSGIWQDGRRQKIPFQIEPAPAGCCAESMRSGMADGGAFEAAAGKSPFDGYNPASAALCYES